MKKSSLRTDRRYVLTLTRHGMTTTKSYDRSSDAKRDGINFLKASRTTAQATVTDQIIGVEVYSTEDLAAYLAKRKGIAMTCTVLDAMRRVEPGADRGALVAFRELWPVCESGGLSRETAERQILALARSGSLCLHRADRCDQSADDLPAGLVIGDNWYVGCHIRQN